MAETATRTLTDFLLARIAEDEALAHISAKRATVHSEGVEAGEDGGRWADWLNIPTARVLAECEAKRRQIAHLIRFMEGDYAPWNEEQLQIMAAVYADHHDYRDEWRA